jgi:uncharacterized phiE125 gp8 family phage protein
MHTQIVVRPAFHPVTLQLLKSHLRETSNAQDALLQDIILPAAHREAASQLGRSLMLTGWLAVLDGFPCRRLIDLPWPQLQAITGVQYRDVDGNMQTLSPAAYGTDLIQSRLYLKATGNWPSTDGLSGCVQISYTSGYASVGAGETVQQASVPANVRNWILLRCGTLYEHREQIAAGVSIAEIPFVGGLLDVDRVWGI